MVDENNILKNEIHLAIHAMLGVKEEDDKALCWSSVGLLNKDDVIKWDSRINENYCGTIKMKNTPYSNFPCFPDSQIANSKKCRTKNGSVAPPCLKDHIEHACEFREQFAELEELTAIDDSFSMGVLSKKYFVEKEEQPYITSNKGGFKQYPWIKKRDDVLNDLNLGQQADESEQAKQYAALAEKCIPEGTTAVLIPLVQHFVRFNYIGSIVICAKTESEIWEHISRIKATALSLAEMYKHTHGITASSKDNFIIRLLNALFDRKFNDRLFIGECTGCSMHLDVKYRHNMDCRLIESFKATPGIFAVSNMELQKSLFAIGSTPISKACPSHPVPVEQVVAFFKNGGIGDIEISFESLTATDSESEENINRKENNSNYYLSWPTMPGLISFVCIFDLYHALNAEQNNSGEGVSSFKITRKREGEYFVFSFVFQTKNKEGLKSLASLWAGLSERVRGPGETTEALKRAVSGVINLNHESKSKYHEKKKDFNDGVPGGKDLHDLIMKSSNIPIFYPFFSGDELRLMWSVKISELNGHLSTE